MKAMAEAPAAPPLDDETAAALTRFNAYVEADRERRRHEQALAKAERVKDEAAAAVRNLNSGQASADEKAAAEAAYREAADALKRLRDGTSQEEPAGEESPKDEADGEAGEDEEPEEAGEEEHANEPA